MKEKIVNRFCRILVVMAGVYVVSPCIGRFCEPKVPIELLKKEIYLQ